jgi:hypothetical protein
MYEVLDTQFIPVAATAAGLAAGAWADRKAINRAAEERQALAEVWSLDDEQPEATPRTNRIRRAGRYVTALAVSAGLAAGLSAEAWVPLHEHADQQTPPALEVVVDHSGATALSLNGNQPVDSEINSVVKQLGGIEDVNAEAWLAGSGEAKPMTLEQATRAPAFGDAPLEQAMQSALGRAGFAAAKRQSPGQHDASVVVITNGNNIGQPRAVAKEAKLKGNAPVFVVNVEGTDGKTAQDLQKIAEQTHGKYWDVRQDNLNSVAGDVKKTITASQHQPEAKPAVTDGTRTMLRVLSILSLIGVGIGYRQRGKSPFNRNMRGE